LSPLPAVHQRSRRTVDAEYSASLDQLCSPSFTAFRRGWCQVACAPGTYHRHCANERDELNHVDYGPFPQRGTVYRDVDGTAGTLHLGALTTMVAHTGCGPLGSPETVSVREYTAFQDFHSPKGR